MDSDNRSKGIESSDEISLRAVIMELRQSLNYLFLRWPLLCVFGILGFGLGFFYSKNKKIIYTAATTFVLEDGDSGGSSLGKYAGLASMAGVDLNGGGGLFQGDNILELYKSRKMIEKTLFSNMYIDGRNELLVDRYIAFNKLREKWADNALLKNFKFYPNSEPNRQRDSVMGLIVEDISRNYLRVLKPDKLLSIIKAEVRGTDELFVKSFNDRVVQNVNDFYIQTKTKKSLQNIEILEKKVDSVRGVMNGAIYSAAAVVDATPNLNPTRQAQRTAPIQRSQFTAEANKDILSELVKNLELSKLSLARETPLIQVIDTPVFPLYKETSSVLKGGGIGALIGFFIISLYLLLSKSIKK